MLSSFYVFYSVGKENNGKILKFIEDFFVLVVNGDLIIIFVF